MEGLAAKLKFGKREMLDQVAIARNLTEATTLVAKALEQAGHPERVKDTFELIEANECVVALETCARTCMSFCVLFRKEPMSCLKKQEALCELIGSVGNCSSFKLSVKLSDE